VIPKRSSEVGLARARLMIPPALVAMALLDALLCRARGLQFTNWSQLALVTLGVAAVGLGYRLTGRSRRLGRVAFWVVLWIVFSVVGGVLTYAVAARGGPLWDARFAALDRAIGFEWTTWFGFVNRHPAIKLPLALAYASLMPQILLAIFRFSWREGDPRNGELLGAVIFSLLLTTALFKLLPSLGPGLSVPAFRELYLDDLLALRNGAATVFAMPHLRGLIAFPSFHAVLAVLFTHAHRGRPGFVAILVLNAVMLLSVPSEGGHYLVDVVAGLAIAAAAILGLHCLRRHERALLLPHLA